MTETKGDLIRHLGSRPIFSPLGQTSRVGFPIDGLCTGVGSSQSVPDGIYEEVFVQSYVKGV